MATVAEPLTQFEIPSSKSTAPPVFFNEPESARTTLPRSQELGQAFPIPADVAVQLVEENSALVEMGSRQGMIIGVVPGNIGFRRPQSDGSGPLATTHRKFENPGLNPYCGHSFPTLSLARYIGIGLSRSCH